MRSSLRITVVVLAIALIAGYSLWISKKGSHEIVIGLTQIIQHPSLDDEREGILAALNEAGYQDGKNVKIIYQNAQGSPTMAAQIATKLVSMDPTVLVGLSTPSAQALMSAIGAKRSPSFLRPLPTRWRQNWSRPTASRPTWSRGRAML